MTEKSKMKYINEHQLRQHAGWSPRSQMHLKYIHYFGNESSDSLLEAYGLPTKDKEQADTLRYKQCPNCNEPNKQDNLFCNKCKMVLTFDAYTETLEKEKKRESEVQNLKDRYEQDMKSMRELLDRLLHLAENEPRIKRRLLINPEPLRVVKVQTPRNNASFIMSKRAARSKLSAQS
ncbi:MAG: hypothetical protein ACRD47_09315 [Nitrososphaeraceae archaeon]